MSECKAIIKIAKQKVLELEGKVLVDFQVHIVEPEFNIAYLIFTDSVYTVNGALTSEVLTITQIDDEKLNVMEGQLTMFKPYSVFLNKKIIQVRSIG